MPPTRIYDETEETRDESNSIIVGDTVLTLDQAKALIQHPTQIASSELAQALIDHLEEQIASIDAQIEGYEAVIKVASGHSDADWYRRAMYARSMRRNSLFRLNRRLTDLNKSATSSSLSVGALANLEAAKIAAASREAMVAMTNERQRELDRMFIKEACKILSKDQVKAIWAIVNQSSA